MRRNLLAERIEWLDTFPHRMTIGALLRALRIVNRSVETPRVESKSRVEEAK